MYLALRNIATTGTASVVAALGIPVFREGTTIHLPGASLQVVNACSGFGTLYAAMAVAAMTAYMSRSTWRRVVVMAVAGPLAVGANVLRVVILSLLVLWQGAEILDTSLHAISGMMTFTLALPIILWVGLDPTEAA